MDMGMGMRLGREEGYKTQEGNGKGKEAQYGVEIGIISISHHATPMLHRRSFFGNFYTLRRLVVGIDR